MTDTSDDTTSNIDPRACALPLVALEPAEICPRCDLPAGAHRRHPSNSPKPQALDPLALAREVASLRSQLEIAHSFHDLVVKERDLERLRVDRLTAELADATKADANDEAYAATLIREKNTAIEELRAIKLRASAALTWAMESTYHDGQALRAVDELASKYDARHENIANEAVRARDRIATVLGVAAFEISKLDAPTPTKVAALVEIFAVAIVGDPALPFTVFAALEHRGPTAKIANEFAERVKARVLELEAKREGS